MPSEEQNVASLANARRISQARNAVNQAKNTVKNVTSTLSLAKQIQPGNDWPYILAFFVAVLKDLLDFVGIGSFPAIGSAVSIICSIFIFFMMLLAGSGKRGRAARALLKGPMGRFLLLGAGTLVEMLFGLNFLPVETAVVAGAYWMLLNERRMSQE
jgi:hypothetical protein